MQPTIPYSNQNNGYGQNPYGARPVDPSIFAPDASSASGNIQFYRNLIQQGKIDPNAAYNSVLGDYTKAVREAPQSAHGYGILGSVTDSMRNELFQPMNIKNTMGRTGLLNIDGTVSLQGAQINKSTTTGAGTTSSSNFTPVAPYDPTKNGTAPGIKIPSVPQFTLPQMPSY